MPRRSSPLFVPVPPAGLLLRVCVPPAVLNLPTHTRQHLLAAAHTRVISIRCITTSIPLSRKGKGHGALYQAVSSPMQTAAASFFGSMLGPRSEPSHIQHAGNTPQTGADTRQDGKVSYGFSLLRGKRASMEDFHHAQFKADPATGTTFGLFGVFDGHGGPNAADFVKNNLFVNLMEHAKFSSDLSAAVVESFETTDTAYLKHDSSSSRDDGCTAVTAVLVGRKLLVANVGDSRAVLSRGGKAVPLSVDHKPNTREERTRIEDAGGVVVWAGTWRVGGVLAVSRAFGDRPLKRYVIPTPDIMEEELTADDDCVILASDGLWDVMSNQDAVALVKDIPDAERAARRLTEEAFQRGSNDNITCVVVKFKFT